MIDKIKKIFHLHTYTPIVSQYYTFHTRRIVYECSCGKRELRNVTKAFSEPFPIETTIFLSDKELYRILKHGLTEIDEIYNEASKTFKTTLENLKD